MRKNLNQFDATKRALKAGKSIVVFIEGSTSTTRKLRKFQKGLAKMLSSFLRDHRDSNVAVLPIAVNFSDANRFRSSVSIEIFPVVEPSEYQLLDNEGAKEITRLTEDLYTIIKPGIYHLEEGRNEEDFNIQLNQFLYHEFPNFLPHVNNSTDMRDRGLKIGQTKIDQSISKNFKIKYWHVEKSITRKIAYYLLTPLALVGYLLNFPPNKLAQIVTASKVKLEAFVAPVLIASNLCFYVLYFLVILILGILLDYWILLLLILIPLCGYLYLYHQHLKDKMNTLNNWDQLDHSLKSEVLNIKKSLV